LAVATGFFAGPAACFALRRAATKSLKELMVGSL
jgi:hypothetical protein